MTLAVSVGASARLIFGAEVGYTFVLVTCLLVPVCGISLALLIARKFNRQLRQMSTELYDSALGSACAYDLYSANSQKHVDSAKGRRRLSMRVLLWVRQFTEPPTCLTIHVSHSSLRLIPAKYRNPSAAMSAN
jgi:hypothetical protein